MSIYLKLGHIKGSCSESDYEQQIKLNNVKFGVQRSVQMIVGNMKDRERSGYPQVQQVVFHKDIDSASPYLLQEVCKGKACGDAEITFTHNDNSYVKFVLNDAILSAYNIVGYGEEKPSEEITISFTKFEMVYTPYDDKGNSEAPIPVSYDLREGTLG